MGDEDEEEEEEEVEEPEVEQLGDPELDRREGSVLLLSILSLPCPSEGVSEDSLCPLLVRG